MVTIEVVPNYGVDYATDTMAIAEWKSEKTFLMAKSNSETSIGEWDQDDTIVIRYDRLRSVCVTTGQDK